MGTKRFDNDLVQRGFYGIGIYQPKTQENIGTLWRSAYCFGASYYCFGASYIFTIGRKYKMQCSDTPKTNKHIPLFYFEDEEDFFNHLPHNCRLVGIETPDIEHPEKYSLENYQHLERACYVLGNEANGLSKNLANYCHQILSIPSKWCLNVSVSGSIVMADRTMKGLTKDV